MSPSRTSTSPSYPTSATSAPPPSSSSSLPLPPPPPPTYLRRIKTVILKSPEKKLSLREIYVALEAQQDFLASRRKGDNGWRNTVRNLLSLNPGFEKVPGERSSAPGRGSYWTVAENAADTFTRTERLRNKSRAKNSQTTGSGSLPARTSFKREEFTFDSRLPSPVASSRSPSFSPPLPSDTPPPSKPLPSLFPLPTINSLFSPPLHVFSQDLHHQTHPLPLLSPPISSTTSSFSPPPIWAELDEEVMGSTSPSGAWVFCERVSWMRSTLHGGSENGGEEGEGEGETG
ncbi:fork head domain-containing protein [Mrakia frigida]|uniref:forkhead box transcription factor n=1 Tax=Mrakia frigida TaxID=29902 RepID=UPI003FCC1BDF